MIIVLPCIRGYYCHMDSRAHTERIRAELKAASAGIIGRRTPESSELIRVINPEEHIGGVVYGVYSGGLAWLIATDERVIFLDRKPFFRTLDELTYDVVAGVTITRAGLFSSVTLHTRVHDYVVNFVNPKSARKFLQYIETKRLVGEEYHYDAPKKGTPRQSSPGGASSLPDLSKIDQEAIEFLRRHELAVLSTVGRTGNVDGAVVYYVVDHRGFVYVLTRSETTKGRNIYAHSQVALTVHESGTMKTVQVQGVAEVETDPAIKSEMFALLVRVRDYQEGVHAPPVTELAEGGFMIIRIKPTVARFHDYAQGTG